MHNLNKKMAEMMSVLKLIGLSGAAEITQAAFDKIIQLEQDLALSMQSEREAWRYHPELEAERVRLTKENERLDCAYIDLRTKRVPSIVFNPAFDKMT